MTNAYASEMIKLTALLTILLIWSFFSYHNWIGDSEFWPITLSGHWNEWKNQPALLYKPLFHLSLSWIYFFELNSVQHIKAAKALYALLGVISFYSMFAILKRYLDSNRALCIVLIFVFSHLGFTQIGLIRSDFLSYFITLMFFLFIKEIRPNDWLKLGGVNFLFALALLLTTPKSLFFVSILFAFSFFSLKGISKFRFISIFFWLSFFTYFYPFFDFFDRL